jgi:hypothetical protein
MSSMVVNWNEKKTSTVLCCSIFENLSMVNIRPRAGAASNCGSDSTKMMRLSVGPAPRQRQRVSSAFERLSIERKKEKSLISGFAKKSLSEKSNCCNWRNHLNRGPTDQQPKPLSLLQILDKLMVKN